MNARFVILGLVAGALMLVPAPARAQPVISVLDLRPPSARVTRRVNEEVMINVDARLLSTHGPQLRVRLMRGPAARLRGLRAEGDRCVNLPTLTLPAIPRAAGRLDLKFAFQPVGLVVRKGRVVDTSYFVVFERAGGAGTGDMVRLNPRDVDRYLTRSVEVVVQAPRLDDKQIAAIDLYRRSREAQARTRSLAGPCWKVQV